MDENIKYNITYTNMRTIVKNYYAEQGKNVSLSISNEIDTDRFAGTVTTLMWLNEITTIAGIKSDTKRYIGIDDLKDIVGSVLEQEGKELVDLTNNATCSSRVEGYGMGEHTENYISNKSFTLIARGKRLTHSR